MPEMPGRAKAMTVSRPYRVLARRVLLPWGMQRFRPTGEALEIGTGSGAMAAELLSSYPDLRLVATDYDRDMVATAATALARFGERAHAQQADAANLPFADGRFDVVASFAMLHHVLDWERALSEAVRVLRPGGHLVGYDVIDTPAARMMHFGASSHVRMPKPGQLEAELARLPLTGLQTHRWIGGVVVRFLAAKAA